LGLVPSVAIGYLLAMLGHFSAVLLGPAFVLLGWEGIRARGRRRNWALFGGLIVAALAVAVSTWSFFWWGLGVRVLSPTSLRALLEGQGPHAANLLDVGFLVGRTRHEFIVPWGLAAVLVPVGILWRPAERKRLAGSAAAALATVGPVILLAPPLEGMYTLILTPFIALCAALSFRRLAPRKGGTLLAWVLVLLQAAVSIPTRARLGQDPDREWAESASSVLRRPALVVAEDSARARLLRRIGEVEAEALNFLLGPTREEILLALEATLSAGKSVYLDSRTLSTQDAWPGLSDLIDRLDLGPLEGDALYPVRGVSAPRSASRPRRM
jgi:hypothetical protein